MMKIGEMSVGELAAFVCSHLKSRGMDVVLSGGSCVTIYASGKYVSTIFRKAFEEKLSLD